MDRASDNHSNTITENGEKASQASEATNSSGSQSFSDWNNWEKQLIIFIGSAAAVFSPLSANIYFPIFNVLAAELNVSNTLINLTVTVYMIFQGLVPSIIGGASDGLGRRPAYIVCFVIYIGANIGLALQTKYAALIVLRGVQSAGSSSTVALASAIVADIATASERGVYIAYATAGTFVAPGVGPIIGGLLAHYLGWRSVFWFLTIFAGAFFVPLLLFFPETCRKIVGDGSIRPAKWNMSLTTAWHFRRSTRADTDLKNRQDAPGRPPLKIPNPLATLTMIFEKEVGMVLASAGLAFGAYYAVSSALPSEFEAIYGFNDIQIALCFIPVGGGCLLAVLTQGRMADYNYKRYALRLGKSVVKTKQEDLTDFPIEKARLEIALPMLLIEGTAIVTYGWVTKFQTNLSGPLILLFVISYSSCAAFTTISILIVDIYPEKAGQATAANNLCRCWLGAGFTAAIVPMINAMGRGWSFTFVGLLCVACAPPLVIVMVFGPQWRRKRVSKEKDRDDEKHAKRLERVTVV
ncbi:major facilitator superfamily domain-containing protein [Usnea florida]